MPPTPSSVPPLCGVNSHLRPVYVRELLIVNCRQHCGVAEAGSQLRIGQTGLHGQVYDPLRQQWVRRLLVPALFKALLGYGGLGCLADQLLEQATRIGLQLHVFDRGPQGCRLLLGDGPFGVVETVLESLQMLPLRERISGKSWGYVNGGALLFPFIGVYRQARGRVVVFVQAFVGIDMDAFHEGGDGRVGDHAGLEVLEQGCAARKDVGHAILGTELGIDTGRIAELERMADEPVGVGREPDLDPCYLVGGGPARSNGLPRQFGDALGQSAAWILFEDGRDESVVPANSAAEGRSILQAAAIEMGVAIDAAEEIDRTGKAA